MEISKLHNDVPDETPEVNAISKGWIWKLFFDWAARRDVARVGVVLISPHKHVIPKGFY